MNKHDIMVRAWRNFKRGGIDFSESLRRSWISEKAIPVNAGRIAEAKAIAGISEAVNTWQGWREKGYTVIHGSKALFGVNLIWGSRGKGAEYKARFFGESQVEPSET